MGINDENSFTIKDALGHASIATTEIYTHLNSTKVAAAYSKWGDKLAAMQRALEQGPRPMGMLQRYGAKGILRSRGEC